MKWGLPILSAIAAVTVVELVLSKIWGYNLSNSSGIFCGETRKAKNTKGGLGGGQTTWKLRRIFSSRSEWGTFNSIQRVTVTGKSLLY